MSRIIFLLEEYSMKVLLEGLLPRLVPGLPFLCIPHEGKQDLEKSIPRKLRAWREPGVCFVIVRDNDGGDCRLLKTRLKELCEQGERVDSLIRIACQELEAGYLGQPEALAVAYAKPTVANLFRRAKYRNPDDVLKPSKKLVSLIPEFQKVSGARRMSGMLTSENRSPSFQAFITGVKLVAGKIKIGNR